MMRRAGGLPHFISARTAATSSAATAHHLDRAPSLQRPDPLRYGRHLTLRPRCP